MASTAKTANYTVVSADFAKRFSCTGTFTLALTTVATLGNGFLFEVSNDGSGIITIDPSGSETINSRTTILVYPGERFQVWCDGVAFVTMGRAARVLVQTNTPSGATTSDFETVFLDTEFNSVEFFVENVTMSSQPLAARVKSGGAYVTSLYRFSSLQCTTAGAVSAVGSTGSARWDIGQAAVLSIPEAYLKFYRLKNIGSNYPVATSFVISQNADSVQSYLSYPSALSALQGVQFLGSSGTITGTIYCYGLREN